MLLSQKLTTMEALQFAPLNNFIKLKNLQIFETQVIFQKNKLGELEKGEIKSLQQKLNLMMIDSRMPELIVDLAHGVFSKKYNGFKDFVDFNSFKSSQIIDIHSFMNRKISDLLEYLLFAKLDQNSIWDGHLNNDNIYCFRDNKSELQFFTIYEKRVLFEFVMNRNVISTNILSEDKESMLLEMKFQIQL